MTTRPRRRFWLKLAAGLLFAVVAYGGAYGASVWRVPAYKQLDLSKIQFGDMGIRQVGFDPRYAQRPVLNSVVRILFVPAHWLDHQLRPRCWGLPDGLPIYPDDVWLPEAPFQ